MTQASTQYYRDNGHATYDDEVVEDGYVLNEDGLLVPAGSFDYAPSHDHSEPLPRSKWLALPLLIPMALSAISYAAGGVPFLTDLSFILLAVICVACIVRELIVFRNRFGVGGLILFGGVLIWFCHDYFNNWFGIDFNGAIAPAWVVAKGAFFHMVFIFFMVQGLAIKKGRWLQKVMHLVPEPRSRSLYFALVLITLFIGMIPFVFFTAEESVFEAIWKSVWGGRSGEGARFTAGRTGNLNYSWGGYLAQLADVGMMGAVLAAFHATIVAKQIWQKIICWAIWLVWLGVAFGTGTRGFTIFLTLPVIMLVFLKYSHAAAAVMRTISVRAYLMTAAVAFGVLVLVQVQGAFRNLGFTADQFDEVDVADLKGNEMFTTSLLGMQVFPDQKPFFFNRFPGEGLVRAPLEEAYWLIIGPIPRALWTSKPISQVNVWYSNTATGETRGAEGTTISNGAVGHPYIRYGPMGVILFGIFYGWMMSMTERALIKAMNRPMALLFTLAFATFVFRCFRDLWWHNLYPIIIAGVVVSGLVWLTNTLFGGTREEHGTPVPA